MTLRKSGLSGKAQEEEDDIEFNDDEFMESIKKDDTVEKKKSKTPKKQQKRKQNDTQNGLNPRDLYETYRDLIKPFIVSPKGNEYDILNKFFKEIENIVEKVKSIENLVPNSLKIKDNKLEYKINDGKTKIVKTEIIKALSGINMKKFKLTFKVNQNEQIDDIIAFLTSDIVNTVNIFNISASRVNVENFDFLLKYSLEDGIRISGQNIEMNIDEYINLIRLAKSKKIEFNKIFKLRKNVLVLRSFSKEWEIARNAIDEIKIDSKKSNENFVKAVNVWKKLLSSDFVKKIILEMIPANKVFDLTFNGFLTKFTEENELLFKNELLPISPLFTPFGFSYKGITMENIDQLKKVNDLDLYNPANNAWINKF